MSRLFGGLREDGLHFSDVPGRALMVAATVIDRARSSPGLLGATNQC